MGSRSWKVGSSQEWNGSFFPRLRKFLPDSEGVREARMQKNLKMLVASNLGDMVRS